MRTPFSAASRASAAVVSPLPRRITSGIRCGSETRTRAPSRSGERTSPTAPGGSPAASSAGRRTSSTSTVTVRERGAAGPEHRGVQALEQLAGDVERDVRPRLEVRSDRADRDPPLAHAKPVRERPRVGFALERRELRHDRDLTHETVDAVVVEAQPVERPLVEAAGRGLVVGRVRGEDLAAPFADESGCNRERVGDGVVAKGRKRRVRGGRLGLDLLSESAHFTLYTARRKRGMPRSASREAEGPAL